MAGSRGWRRGLALALVLALASCEQKSCVDANVATQHNDRARTGAYLAETVLTPQKVAAQGMHLAHSLVVDNSIVTQPLYVHNVDFQPPRGEPFSSAGLFVGTQNNHLYGLRADDLSMVWDFVLKDENPRLQAPRGINSTPVIDVFNHRMFVLFSAKEFREIPEACSTDACRAFMYKLANANSAYTLVSIDIQNGQELQRVRVRPEVQNNHGDLVTFDALGQNDRPGLLLDHGSVYLAFGAEAAVEGQLTYFGWIVRFKADNLLAKPAVFNTGATSTTIGQNCPPYANPNATALGSGIWQGGGGLAADGDGNVYFLTGNGRSNHLTASDPMILAGFHNWYGDSIVKLRPSGNRLLPLAYSPPEADCLEKADADLGSGGALVIPDSNRVVGGGKSGYMYLLKRDTMELVQRVTAATNTYHPELRDQDWDVGPHIHGAPTYWRGPDKRYGYFYLWGEKDVLKLYRFDTSEQEFETKITGSPTIGLHKSTPIFRKAQIVALPDTMPGGILSISADGNKSGTGIVWATLPDTDCTPGKFCPKPPQPPFGGHLYAFDAESLQLLWHTHVGLNAHWAPPTIAGGRVYVATGDAHLLEYELGNGGSDREANKPPQPVEACSGCHTEEQKRALLARLPARHDRFEDEASIGRLPKLTLDLLHPPADTHKDLVFEGNGINLYRAQPDAQGKLEWSLKESTADLLEVPKTRTGRKEETPATRVQLLVGNVWYASDGSKLVARIHGRMPAPESKDADWMSLDVIKSSDDGLLAGQRFIQMLYTHAGHAPAAPPASKDAVARVPYHAEYWVYR